MDHQFTHLHLHSEYSLVDGLIRIKPLVKAVATAGMPAVAVTDLGNLFALVRFYRAALGAGIKPLAGAELWLANAQDANKPYRLVLLVQNGVGYRNLTRLVSRGYLEGQHLGLPQVRPDWVVEAAEGLIALSGGIEGDVARAMAAGRHDTAERRLDDWLAAFGDRYYLEVTRTGRQGEAEYLAAAVELAGAKGVPVVATNDVRFLAAEDFEAHEARVCIHEGRTLDDPRRVRRYSPEQFLRTPRQMAELFADLPEALENSVEIAKRCNLELRLGESVLPAFPVPPETTIEAFFAERSRAGLEWRLRRTFDTSAADFAEHRRVYDERLELELQVINQMGFPGYFLIVADFIQWAKDNGIPVGPGRGSGAGSLVAYALKITDLDPIEHDLLFERFLNPERVSMPDFDVDFCMEKRDRVIDYVAQRYGRQAVSQIITFGTMAAKAVVRDVGRVLGHPYGFVDKVAKMVPFELGMTLKKALEESEDLKAAYEDDEEVRGLIDLARKLEGLARNAGKHAGGVVIAPTELTDFAPLYCEPGGENLVTQYDKDDVEQVGLVKFDFLGLRTLTIIDWALRTINAGRAERDEEPIDIALIDPADPKAFALLKRCETTAVFQLESRGMKELIKKLKPDSFEDMTALVALFRPGPLQSGMVDDFIARKHGEAAVAYPHPDLEPILKPTYGVILYQEQVMQIAQVLASYTLGGADLLRRAMGKKKVEEMDKQRAIFEQGAVARGVAASTATYIFDLMEKFAGYGFNKSHSAAYALVSYQTLWLKANYPAAFMAAVLSADMDNTDKVVGLIDECRAMGLTVIPPCINRSEYRFTIADEGTVVYGIGAIKGVGEAAIEATLAARRRGGAFRDLWDLCRRIDLQKANRRVLEALIRAGACDGLGPNRATLMVQLPLALKLAEQQHETQAAGQGDLFGAAAGADATEPDPQLVQLAQDEWEDEQVLQGEKETLGLYLTGHPIDRYEAEIAAMTRCRIGALIETDRGRGERERRTVVGLVVGVRQAKTQRGRLGTVTLDDRTGRIEATCFAELYERVRDRLVPDAILAVTGTMSFDEYRDSWSLRADEVQTLEEARLTLADHLELTLDLSDPAAHRRGEATLAELREALTTFRDEGLPVCLDYRCPGARGRLLLGRDWRVSPSEALLKRLRQVLGPEHVQVSYERLRAPVPSGVLPANDAQSPELAAPLAQQLI
ncbi:DNA-directed DNA polymerase III PolC [Thioflavicoccus mobilis 8321]|uniref:DNA polymerase III subunit alpha n=1 Tax=Thioflavicoccus mobilis 8321 TaxID=765912 RepID=L0GWA6_9GAMM|nr:DNA polymerase III subunit alpha [Thioflavicoccus mobilis]AGA91033.1 DNA-directed DNA polymerase III PolC [Thioflavicoccus mobilis 8321]